MTGDEKPRWTVLGLGPMQQIDPGEPIPTTTPLVECPEGHKRRVTLREQTQDRLECPECEATYPVVWEEEE